MPQDELSFSLSARLALAAALVPQGSTIADIGTDHAYLPAWLILEGIATRAIAADVGQGPLQNAAQTLANLGLGGRIPLRLSDGLDGFSPGDANCLIFAGMGGTLIARLLARAPWVNAPGMTIVAQPMRRTEDLRRWLLSNGWRIETETACFDAGRPYSALRAVYAPQKPLKETALRPGYAFYGELPRCGHPAAQMLLERTRRWLAGRIAGLERGGNLTEESARLRVISADLEAQI